MTPLLAPIIELGTTLIDKLFTSDEEKNKAKLELLKMEQEGTLKDMQVRLSAIMAEAQSSDPWTSRARPCFLYVCYILILFAIPMGIVSAVSGSTALNIANGFGAWLSAIPEQIVELMGWVMLGYIGGRSVEKIKRAAK